jgi:hypothetical protein
MRAVKVHYGDSCPKCKDNGVYSKVNWELHPWDKDNITMEDQVHGFCDKCGVIIFEADLLFRVV